MILNKKKKVSLTIVTICIIILAIATIIVRQNNPEESKMFIPCIIRLTTGVKCPGCGMTRSVHYLANGNIKMAMWYNLMLIPGILVLCYSGYRYLRYIIKDEDITTKTLSIILAIFLVVIIIFGITRNFTTIFY